MGRVATFTKHCEFRKRSTRKGFFRTGQCVKINLNHDLGKHGPLVSNSEMKVNRKLAESQIVPAVGRHLRRPSCPVAHGGRLGERFNMHPEHSGAATTRSATRARRKDGQQELKSVSSADCAESVVSACCSLCTLSHRAAPASPLFLADHLQARQPWV